MSGGTGSVDTSQRQDLSDLARKGQEFILEEIGFEEGDFEILGRISQLGRDGRVREIYFEEYEEDIKTFSFWVYLSRTLTIDEFTKFVERSLQYDGDIVPAHDEKVSLDIRGPRTSYSLNFSPVSYEGE